MPLIVEDNLPLVFASLRTTLDLKLAGKAQGIKRLAQAYAPFLSGDLHDSMLVEKKGLAKYEISANTAYARRRHYENNAHPNTKFYLKRAGDTLGDLGL